MIGNAVPRNDHSRTRKQCIHGPPKLIESKSTAHGKRRPATGSSSFQSDTEAPLVTTLQDKRLSGIKHFSLDAEIEEGDHQPRRRKCIAPGIDEADYGYTDSCYKQQSILELAVGLLKSQLLTGGAEASHNPFPEGLSSTQYETLRIEITDLRFYQPLGQDERYTESKTISGLSVLSAAQLTFEDKRNQRITSVADYYSHVYGNLRCPNLPCLEVSGHRGKPTYVPLEHAELCRGQPRTMCKPRETNGNAGFKSEMMTVTRCQPDVRHGKILSLLADELSQTKASKRERDGLGCRPNAVPEPCRYMQAFGVKTVQKNPQHNVHFLASQTMRKKKDVRLSIRADVPHLHWGQAPAEPMTASIHGSPVRKLFTRKNKLTSWGIVELVASESAALGEDVMNKFVQGLQGSGNGLEISDPLYLCGKTTTMLDNLREICTQIEEEKDGQCQLILVIKPNKSNVDYNLIKTIGDTMIGVPTQCILKENVMVCAMEPGEVKGGKYKKACLQHMLLKINAKLGGITMRVFPNSFAKHVGDPAWMAIGAKSGEDINACVGTMDRACTSIAQSYRWQNKHGETIQHIGDMVCSLVEEFEKRNSCFPEKLVIYRDAVQDVLFQKVANDEVKEIKMKCSELGRSFGGYKPTITFIFVKKCCHRMRDDGDGNTLEKAVVINREPSSGGIFDFCLFSNTGSVLTRASRYTVLYDDNHLTANDLEMMTYNMCFTDMRCLRAAAIVPVLHSAGLLIARTARHQHATRYIAKKSKNSHSSWSLRGNGGNDDEQQFQDVKTQFLDARNNVMIAELRGKLDVSTALSDRPYYV